MVEERIQGCILALALLLFAACGDVGPRLDLYSDPMESSSETLNMSSSNLSSSIQDRESSSGESQSRNYQVDSVKINDFTLAINDDFNDLELNFWELGDGSWPENRVMFTNKGVSVDDGVLKLKMRKELVENRVSWGQRRLGAPDGEDPDSDQDVPRFWSSGELRSLRTYKYGRFETSIKSTKFDYYIAAFTLFHVPRDEQWLEINLELFSHNDSVPVTNLFIDKDGAADVIDLVSVRDQMFPHLGVKIDHHEYNDLAIEWTPDYIAWFVNGDEIRRVTDKQFIPNEALYVLFNFWISFNSLYNDIVPDDYLTGKIAVTEFDYFRYYKWDESDEFEFEGWCGNKSWNGTRCVD